MFVAFVALEKKASYPRPTVLYTASQGRASWPTLGSANRADPAQQNRLTHAYALMQEKCLI